MKAGALLLAAACTQACTDEDRTDVIAPVMELSLATFNTALGVGLTGYLEQRLAAIEGDLDLLHADVICLQEVWQPQMIEHIAQSALNDMPYAYWSVHASAGSGSGASGCTQAEADSLSSCLADNCSGLGGSVLALCAVGSCQDLFGSVSKACQDCIAANQTSDVERLGAICAGQEGAAAAYEDQNGLVLLSRLPLEGTTYRKLDSSFGERGVLSARVRTDFAGSVGVFCTHLAATLGAVTYDGPFGSWEGEREHQIGQLLGYMSEPASGARVLMGDLNCGPVTPTTRGAGAEAFALFTDAGFEDPYAEQDASCTWCSDNPLTDGSSPGDLGAILDHVLFAGFPSGLTFSAQREFSDAISVEDGGVLVETRRSDHYAVSARVFSE